MVERRALDSGRVLAWLVVLAAVVWAGWRAYSAWWVTDDAFISFRYAQNLVDGLGLVFNVGERVEGYTNPLWTLWIGAALAAGLDAEVWANGSGIACYLGAILLLAVNSYRLSSRAGLAVFPLAAVGAAVHPDWNVFATSGLETSSFTFLLVAGYVLAVWNRSRPAGFVICGFVFALATLTRPDGLLLAFVTGLFILASAHNRWKNAILYAVGFAVIWVPFTVWRVQYYGEFFPNTYYAKSAYQPWYEQGFHYVQLYFERYWVLVLAPLLLLASLLTRRLRNVWATEESAGTLRRQVILAASLALSYAFYVAHVGGDFMFARMLIPATPFLLILLEAGSISVLHPRPTLSYAMAGLVLAVIYLSPSPVTEAEWRYGVANEWMFYSEERVARSDHQAEVLNRYFTGLPARVAFYGGEARLVYKAGFEIAIESAAGLTEYALARQELTARGRPGHEKRATPEYLIDTRRANFTFSGTAERVIRLNDFIPKVMVQFEEGVVGRIVRWDSRLLAELSDRGARVPDFVKGLDTYIANLDQAPRDQVENEYRRLKRFYFDSNNDPTREQAFRRRLGVAEEEDGR